MAINCAVDSATPATADELEAAAARMLIKAAAMRAAQALEPEAERSVIVWTQASISTSGLSSATYVAVKTAGKWWTSQRGCPGLPWAQLCIKFPALREGNFEVASGWRRPGM